MEGHLPKVRSGGRDSPHGVTVNAVAPALVAGTGMIPGDGEEERRAVGRISASRFGKPEEVAEAALMLATNPFITVETVFSVDGGLYPR
jgi:3-oxoacyl-[acyl-carrier protein] reductase